MKLLRQRESLGAQQDYESAMTLLAENGPASYDDRVTAAGPPQETAKRSSDAMPVCFIVLAKFVLFVFEINECVCVCAKSIKFLF